MSIQRVAAGAVVVAMLLLTLPGCGNKVSRSNYDKIQTGMTQAEVEAILGKGTEEVGAGGALGKLTGSAKVISWKDGQKTITVSFANEKVVAKAQQGL